MSGKLGRIYLQPEVASGLGEDTFWTWFARETNASFELPSKLERGDIVLHYSTLGKPRFPNQTISLLWELYPEMELRLGTQYKKRSKLIEKSMVARWATCPTHYSRAFYSKDTRVLPIGVDTKLFSPAINELEVRNLKLKHSIPEGRPVAIWCGANHPMKGPDIRDTFSIQNPDFYIIEINKENPLTQGDVAELLKVSDGWLNTSRLIPLFMFEWEALASGLKLIPAGGTEREFNPDSPREFVENMNWSREKALKLWLNFIEQCAVETYI